jgi:hypothetical protein
VQHRKVTLCCASLWAIGLSAKDVHREMYPVYGGKCLSRKAVHNWEANVSLMKRLKRGCAVAETTVKRLLCSRLRRTSKAMGQVCQCWWRICREINVFFQVPISRVLRFISNCSLFTKCPPYVKGGNQLPRPFQ